MKSRNSLEIQDPVLKGNRMYNRKFNVATATPQQKRPAGMNTSASKQTRYQSNLRPADVANAIDPDMAHMMGDRRSKPSPFPQNYKKPADASTSQIQDSASMFTKSIGFLNQKLGILQGDKTIPSTMPKNSRAKMPTGDINKKARDAIVDKQILDGMLDLVINIDQETYDKLDKLDQDALEAWHKNYNNMKARQGERLNIN